MTAVVLREVRKFLLAVEKDALAPPISAAAPFTLGLVLGHWAKVVEAILRAVPHVTDGMADRLLRQPIPDQAYSSARSVLNLATEQGWSDARLASAMAAAMTLDSGTTSVAVAPAEPDGSRHLGGIALGLLGTTWLVQAQALAETEATAVAGFSSLQALADEGFTSKVWVSRHDNRVRATHSAADGQVQLLGATFDVGGEALMVPGDPAGSAKETARCRCAVAGVRDAEG